MPELQSLWNVEVLKFHWNLFDPINSKQTIDNLEKYSVFHKKITLTEPLGQQFSVFLAQKQFYDPFGMTFTVQFG